MRWLHISDMHFGRGKGPDLSEEKTWERLLEHVEERTSDGLGPDYIFITGDITWNGSENSFKLAKDRIPKLLEKAGLGNDSGGWRRIFIVPGNHDVPYVRGTWVKNHPKPAMGKEIHARFGGTRNPSLDSVKDKAASILNTNVTISCPALGNYRKFINDNMLNARVVTEVPTNSMTFFARLKESKIPVGVICMNTAWASYKSDLDDEEKSIPCGSELVKTAIDRLASKNDLKLLILLGHHPAKSLYDFDDIKAKAENKKIPLLYLRGHRHDTDFESSSGIAGPCTEISVGAMHLSKDKHGGSIYPHRIMWGVFDGEQIEFEPLCHHHPPPEVWTLDTEAFRNRDFQDYRLSGTIKNTQFDFPLPLKRITPQSELHFVGIGLAALSTVCTTTKTFTSAKDYKVDVYQEGAPRFWEPELGTFATIVCNVLKRWKRNVALITSIGDDYAGRLLRRPLSEREIGLLFCREVPSTGRQIVMTPRDNPNIRYNIDLQIPREPLIDLETMKLERVIPTILSAKWIAFDKYELATVKAIFADERWKQAIDNKRPMVMFESGSMPSPNISIMKVQEPQELKSELLDNIDLFTTTCEWIEAINGRTSEKNPDLWSKDDLEEKKFRGLLKTSLPRLMPYNNKRPKAVLVTLSSYGCYVAFRATGKSEEYTIEHLPVPEQAKNVQSRVGAGDIFRAALIQALLDTKVDDLTKDTGKSLLDVVDLAQYVASRWIGRSFSTEIYSNDYFGDFPTDFEVLKQRHKELIRAD